MNEQVELYDGEEYVVRSVTGSAARRAYLCPACHQQIRPATPHVVAWPVVPTGWSGVVSGGLPPIVLLHPTHAAMAQAAAMVLSAVMSNLQMERLRKRHSATDG